MQIFSTIENLTEDYTNVVVALGTFDGVHVGHQNIIRKAIDLAKKINGTSVVFTFSNHPLGLVSPKKCPVSIIDNKDKEELMEILGVDVLMNIPFTQEFLKLTPVEFLGLLRENLAPKYIVVGPNYSFGYRGEGNPALLTNISKDFGFLSEIQPVVHMDHKVVSSTRIRKLIADGQIVLANKLLGKRFKLRGRVVYGDQRGRTLGFPTANFDITPGKAVPKNGVYAVHAIVCGKAYHAIANIGINPTFAGLHRHIEVHLFDFAGDLYGQIIEIQFIERLRGECQFSSVEQLITQIKLDVDEATALFSLQ